MSTQYHLHLDVRGALSNWDDRQFRGMFEYPTGQPMTPQEAKAVLLDELAAGRKLLPLDDCEGFDYAGGGCPGHPVEAQG